MPAPTSRLLTFADHTLVITNTNGNTLHARIVVVTGLSRYGYATLVVETTDMLSQGEYEAIYTTASQSLPGIYEVHSFLAITDAQWFARGIFTLAKQSRSWWQQLVGG